MKLSEQQLAEYRDRGFLRFPNLLSDSEIAILQREIVRLTEIQSDEVAREHSGGVKAVFQAHDLESPTASAPIASLTRLPRILGPAQQILNDDQLYIYHTKANVKEAIDGTIWQWHQDYGYWLTDGLQSPELTTALVMFQEATEIGGCLYFIPGSHRAGRIDPIEDESTSYKLWVVPKDPLIDAMERFGDPVPMTGKPGTVVFFHPNLIHGSGHNMSRYPRWHFYAVFNRIANKPKPIPKPRPEWAVSRKYIPLVMGDDQSIVNQPAVI
jgi:ectoine hydroxylase